MSQSSTSFSLRLSASVPLPSKPNLYDPKKNKKSSKHIKLAHGLDTWEPSRGHEIQNRNYARSHFSLYPQAPKPKLHVNLSSSHKSIHNIRKSGTNKFNNIPFYQLPQNSNLTERTKIDLSKGLFPANELIDYNAKDYPNMDAQCIIRFPFQVAELLRSRLEKKIPLGLTITSTHLHDYRFFEIKVDGIEELLEGILLELPNLVESYKTLDGDLMFKSADISQIIMVYSPSSPEALNLPVLEEMYNWEWKSGLTPATKNIRRRKFKNFNVFDKQQIRNAELEVIEVLNGLSRDSYEYLAQTEFDMVENSDKFQLGESNERVITINDDLQQFLEDGCGSDASDEFFGLPHTPWTPQDSVRPPGTARIGRPRRQQIMSTTPNYPSSPKGNGLYIHEDPTYSGMYQKYKKDPHARSLTKQEKKLLKEKRRLEKEQKTKLLKTKENAQRDSEFQAANYEP